MNSKNTKRALVSSALAMLVCVALLIGTTFAWFTDTAKVAPASIAAQSSRATALMTSALLVFLLFIKSTLLLQIKRDFNSELHKYYSL